MLSGVSKNKGGISLGMINKVQITLGKELECNERSRKIYYINSGELF